MADTRIGNATEAILSYIQLFGKVEEADETSYERQTAQGKSEEVRRVQLVLAVPGMQERVRCELPLESAPTAEALAQWELEETWVVVAASGMRALAFKRANTRPNERDVGALVVFTGVGAREATAEERRQLQVMRKAQKIQAKQRRAQRQAEKQAAREAGQTASAEQRPA